MRTRRRLVLLIACSLTACRGAETLSAPSAQLNLTASSGPKLLQCGVKDTTSSSGLVTPLGGTVSVSGHSIVIPGGGLLDPTAITITEPASRYVEIGIQAGDLEHFQFELPVLVTISYARCSRSNLAHGPLSAWYIDPVTHELLADMGGVDDKIARTVSFFTTHLSGYAIAE